MGSGKYMVDINLTNESLNPMLPQVVGAIEELDEASFYNIKKDMETYLNKKISDTDLKNALDNGMKLGIVKMRREFKICKEFTTPEIKRLKCVEENLWTESKTQMLGMDDEKNKNLWDFVKYHRNQRKKKMTVKHNRQRTNIDDGYDLSSGLSEYLCAKCRRSVEKKRSERSRSRHNRKEDAWGEDDGRSSERSETETKAKAANKKKTRKRDKKQTQDKNSDEKSQGKSRLLVEKNPLETEPPYYDIFT